jgi:hypothetical protein
MFGNCVRTGKEATAAVRRLTLQDHHRALAACFVAVAGAATQGAAVCRVVASAARTAGTTTAVSASSFRNYNYNPSFCTKLKTERHWWSEASEWGTNEASETEEMMRGKIRIFVETHQWFLQKMFKINQSAEGATENISVVPSALLYQSGHECRGSVLRTAPPAWELSSLRDFCSGSGNRRRKSETESDIGEKYVKIRAIRGKYEVRSAESLQKFLK